jgi:hypothetical protein
LRAQGFKCSLDVLYRGLCVSEFKSLIKNIYKKFSAVYFYQFFVMKSPDPDWYSATMLDPDPESMNPDPQHCLQLIPTSVIVANFVTLLM